MIFKDGIPYHNKMNLTKLRKFDSFLPNVYLTGVSKVIPNRVDFYNSIIEDPKFENKQHLLVSIRDDVLLTIDRKKLNPKIILLTDHPRNFHQLYDTYIYCRGNYFDPHPRLLIECVYYQKEIIVLDSDDENKKRMYDGGDYRLTLINSLPREEIINLFNFKKDDPILEYLTFD